MTNEQLVIRIKAGADVADNMLQLWRQCRRFIFKMTNRIRQGMASFIHNNGTVRIPVHEQGSLHQYRKLCNAFWLEEGREPTDREIGHCLGMGIKDVGRLKEAARMAPIGSLDAPLDEEGDASLSDAIAAPYDLEADALDEVKPSS